MSIYVVVSLNNEGECFEYVATFASFSKAVEYVKDHFDADCLDWEIREEIAHNGEFEPVEYYDYSNIDKFI